MLIPAQLAIVGNVAPDEFLGDAIPGRAFGPDRAGLQSKNRSAIGNEGVELRIEADDASSRIGKAAEAKRFLGRGRGSETRSG